MPDSLARLLATVAVWAAALGIIIALAASGQEVEFIIVGVVMVTSAGATATIWGNAHKDQDSSVREAEKSKRRSRVERLLESMDDHELEELRSRLNDNDGEMLTLDEVLAERRRR